MLKRSLNLRIYRRNRQAIVLLWDKLTGEAAFDAKTAGLQIHYDDLPNSQGGNLELSNVVVGVREADLPRALLQEFHPNGQTVICVIGHETNQLDPDTAYYFKVACYGETAGVKVMPAGILPMTEHEDKKKHVHLYAWDVKRSEWGKLCGVRDNEGRFGLLTIQAEHVPER